MRHTTRSIDMLRLAGQAGLLATCAIAAACSGPVEKVWQYQSHSASRSTPAIAGDLIVFGTESGEVHAITRSGSYRWKFQAGKEVISAPAVLENLIFFGSTNSNLYAVDRAGRQVWKYPTFARIKGDPVVVGTNVCFGSYDKHLYCLNSETQKEDWIYPPNVVDGRLVEAPPPPDDLKEGEEPPQYDKSMWPTDAFSYAKPLVWNGMLISGNLDGHLYAADLETGEFKWRWASEGAKDGKGITSSVKEKDGVLFFGANDGNVYALDGKSRKVLWKFKTGDEVNSSAVWDDGTTLYIGSRDQKLYALDMKTGAKTWEFSTTGPIVGIPALYKNLLIFGASKGDGHVYVLDKRTGKEFWKYKTDGEVDADPIVDGNMFFIASGDRNLYAFKINKVPE